MAVSLPAIMPQLVVIVEVLVAKRNPKHPLANQRRHRMFHPILAPVIAKTRREPIHQTDRPVGRAQKQPARIRRYQPGIEGCIHNATFNDSKIKPFCATLRRHRGSPRIIEKWFSQNNFR
jgi:hypothetical protein